MKKRRGVRHHGRTSATESPCRTSRRITIDDSFRTSKVYAYLREFHYCGWKISPSVSSSFMLGFVTIRVPDWSAIPSNNPFQEDLEKGPNDPLTHVEQSAFIVQETKPAHRLSSSSENLVACTLSMPPQIPRRRSPGDLAANPHVPHPPLRRYLLVVIVVQRCWVAKKPLAEWLD